MNVPRVLFPIVLLAALLLGSTGCATPAAPAGTEVVVCPKCETVWVESADPRDLDTLTYVSKQTMRCPDCHSAVATFFRTGVLAHSCDTCGSALLHCTRQP